MSLNLKGYRKQYSRIARELGYTDNFIAEIETATSIREMECIMARARNSNRRKSVPMFKERGC